MTLRSNSRRSSEASPMMPGSTCAAYSSEARRSPAEGLDCLVKPCVRDVSDDGLSSPPSRMRGIQYSGRLIIFTGLRLLDRPLLRDDARRPRCHSSVAQPDHPRCHSEASSPRSLDCLVKPGVRAMCLTMGSARHSPERAWIAHTGVARCALGMSDDRVPLRSSSPAKAWIAWSPCVWDVSDDGLQFVIPSRMRGIQYSRPARSSRPAFIGLAAGTTTSRGRAACICGNDEEAPSLVRATFL